MTRAALASVAAALLLFGCSAKGHYNVLVDLDERVEQQFSNLDVALQRRADLIPNLVATVQGAAGFEQSTYTEIAQARGVAQSARRALSVEITPEAMMAYMAAQRSITSGVQGFLAHVEAYPELKATTAFSELATQLESAENRIATERRRYNAAVKEKNTRIKRFPSNLYARAFGFGMSPYFQADADASTAPNVEFAR